MNRLPSSHQIGDSVRVGIGVLEIKGAASFDAEVVGVHFTASKVTYDLQPKAGGEVVRNVDSVWLENITLSTPQSTPNA